MILPNFVDAILTVLVVNVDTDANPSRPAYSVVMAEEYGQGGVA
jgi:hypothetical protein